MQQDSEIKPGSLRACLDYEPQVLNFGTSGRRGEVRHLTQLEVYLNSLAELEYLQSLSPEEGGIVACDEFYFASDLRPSSARFVPEQGGRGEIAQAIEWAIRDAGLKPVNLGRIPTPALTCYALERRKGSIMITGSHIPFDRNGYKTNTAKGELLKKHEAPINERVAMVRQRLYDQPYEESLFDGHGFFKLGHKELTPPTLEARDAYLQRYTEFLAGLSLKGRRLLVYQHSAVGRDLLVELLRRLGAEVIPAGASDTFVPIDTENIDAEQLAKVQALAVDAWQKHGVIDAVVSTDGDSDRPLILGVEQGTSRSLPCQVRFFGGDLAGMVTAEYLRADAVVVPISCNDALDRGPLRAMVEPKTRIGSPYVIAGMEKAKQKGRMVICGWEANGGFLTGSDIVRDGRVLSALPTRDAFLPILCVLFAMNEKNATMTDLFARLPRRFSRAALLKKFPRPVSLDIMKSFSPPDGTIKDVLFEDGRVVLLDEDGNTLISKTFSSEAAIAMKDSLGHYFTREHGFDSIVRLNYIDGIRIYFANGEVAHARPSGNADELRIYAVADSQERADAIAALGVAESGGILRQLEKAVSVKTRTAQDSQRCSSAVSCGNVQDAIAAFKSKSVPLLLRGAVQHYEWGGADFIPSLLRIDNAARKPFAELWIGAHANAPSSALIPSPGGEGRVRAIPGKQVHGQWIPLNQLIEGAGEQILGSLVTARFLGRLPYLLKVLDVGKMLSIQAHPTKPQAEAGYARENAAGISLKDAHRNYKDDNHKPEAHVALTDFWMLHGFRPLEEIATTFKAMPELSPLTSEFATRLAQAGQDAVQRSAALRELYQTLMTMPQERVDAILNLLIARLQKGSPPEKGDPAFWFLRAAGQFDLPGGHRDRGLFSIYLLNLVHLRPGEGTYQPAGTLHAYLEGVNVELMANSDNVLRGGLTSKHVDVAELTRTLDFASGRPTTLNGERVSATEAVFRTPAEEFELSQIRILKDSSHAAGPDHSADSLLVVEGSVSMRAADQTLNLERGNIALVPFGMDYTLKARGESAVVFKASIPIRPL